MDSRSGKTIFSWQVGERLERELLRRYCQTLTLGQLVSMINAAILVWLIWDYLPPQTLVGWLLAVVVIAGLRSLQGFRLTRLPEHKIQIKRWKWMFTLSAILAGVSWGATAYLFLPHISDADRVVLLSLYTGMGAGALGLLNTLKWSYRAYLLPLTLPAIFWCLLQEDHSYQVLGVLLVIFDVVMFRSSAILHNNNKEAITVRYEQAEMYELLQRAEEITHTGSWLWDLPSDAMYWTDEHYHLLGLDPSRDEASYERYLAAAHPEDRQKIKQALFNSISRQDLYYVTHRIFRPDGSCRHVRAHARLELGDDASVMRMIGTLTDISHEVENEQALLDAKEMAEHASYAKSDFLAMMSHEIRSPMNGVLGMLELLKNSRLDAEQNGYANTAYNSANILLSLLNDILDYSKIESGKLLLEETTLNIPALFNEVMSLYGAQARAKGISLSLWIDPKIPGLLLGDPLRIRQIIINFVSNAIKFTVRGGVEIEVLSLGKNDSQQELKFSVRDTGIGVDEQIQASLFSPFVQADTSMSRRYGGSGLGLSIAQRLVALMHGEIGIESTLGQGATFWCTIPLRRVNISELDAEVLAGMFAVILTDDPQLQLQVSFLLDAWGVEYEAHGSVDLLGKVQQYHRSTLLLVDERLIHDQLGAHATLLAEYKALISVGDSIRSSHRISISRPVLESELYELLLVYKNVAADRHASKKIREGLSGHILLVEDNQVNQMVAQSMLAKLGVSVDLAENGQEALALWRKQDYQLILMDCQMPVLDGFAASALIRKEEQQTPEGGRVPIIALTANLGEGISKRCLDAGMDDYLAKPCKFADLSNCLALWLNSGVVESVVTKPAASTRVEEILDSEVISALQQLMGNRFATLLDTFRKTTRDYLAAMAEAAQSGDSLGLAEQAHGLKGSAANIGACQIRAMAEALQLAPERFAELQPSLQTALHAFEQALSAQGVNLVALH